jgi:hypothetical protein
LTFATMDRLRPDFAVAWHNWIAPREFDVMFYTGPEKDKPGRRAWDVFTQHFPSPRAAGHRWNDETTPAKYDWQGRKWNERNVHQYAAKHYGTRVWGWEMPWWQRTPDDARRLGPAYARAFLAAIDLSAADAAKEPLEAAAVTVPRWEPHEFVLRGKAHVANPFRDAALVGEFTAPSGKTVVVEGFHDGGDTWKLRFAPWEEGEWKYLLRGEGVELFQRGRLTCTAPRGHGFIGIHKDNPYAFAYSDGTPFFPMGDTCYGLFDDTPITPELREKYLTLRREQRFNFVRMSIGHSAHRAAADPAHYWAWGGTPDKPDLDRFNPAFFQGMDELLRQMRVKGMNAELLLLNYYRRPFTDPTVWTPDRERLWLRYVTARFAAFPNIFLWTVANEYETHPDGKYRLDVPGDPDWAKGVARLVGGADPYRHPVTVHPVVSASTKAQSPRAPFDPPWRVGEFFGSGKEISVISQQTGQHGEGTVWDEKLKCWTGDSATLVESLRADRKYKKPVLNTENGYEYLRGDPTSKQQVHHTDKVRRTSWRIVCAGGYFAAGFHGTIGHSDVWNRIDTPNRYDFVLKDEGAAGQLALLYDFFSALPYWRMRPFDGVKGDIAVALAEPGEVYAVYLPKGGKLTVDLTGTKGRFQTRWFNPRDGKWTEAAEAVGGGRPEFAAPDANDWALLLRRPGAGDK